MKKRFFFTLFFALVSFSNADDECSSFVGEIEKYKKETLLPIVVNKNFPLSDELIFMYPRHKNFLTRVDSYLKNLTTIEKVVKGTPCSKLAALSPTDEIKSGAIKREVKKILINNFDKALEDAYRRMVAHSSQVNLESCDGYGDNATKLISKYYQSDSEQHAKWVREAIERYEECKQGEVPSNPIVSRQQSSSEVAPLQPTSYDQLSSEQIDEKIKDCSKCEDYQNSAKNSPGKNIQKISEGCKAFCQPQQQTLLPVTNRSCLECSENRKDAKKSPNSPRWKRLVEECDKTCSEGKISRDSIDRRNQNGGD